MSCDFTKAPVFKSIKEKSSSRKGITLYFFPALIPLAPLIPMLLAAVGGSAAVFQLFKKQWRRVTVFVCALSFALAAGVYWWQYLDKPLRGEGSRLRLTNSLPKHQVIQENVLSWLNSASPGTINLNSAGLIIKKLWSRPLASSGLSTPSVAGDLILLGTHGSEVLAFDRFSGKQVWKLEKREPVFATPLISGKQAYFGEGLHLAVTAGLTAVSFPEGKPLWERQFLGHVETPPLVRDDLHRMWMGGGPTGLWCLDPRDGAVIWRRDIGHIDSTPLLVDGTIFSASQPDLKVKRSVLFAMDRNTGETKWQKELEGQPWGSSSIDPNDPDIILITTSIGRLQPREPGDRGWSFAISKRDGKIKWSSEFPSMILMLSPTLKSEGLVYHAVKSGDLVAQRTQDGSIAWKKKLESDIYAPTTLYEGPIPLLFTISIAGTLYIHDARSGVELQQLKFDKDGTSSVAIKDNIFYVATPKQLVAYEMSAKLPIPTQEIQR